MKTRKPLPWHRLTPYLFIFVLWLFTVALRSPYFGKLSDGHHQWLTASSSIYLENWVKVDPRRVHFRLNDAPAEMGLKSYEERFPYLSYPSGSILIPYLLYVGGKLFSLQLEPPLMGLLMGLNLFYHLIIALLLFPLAQIVMRQFFSTGALGNFPTSEKSGNWFPLLTPVFYLLTEKPLYWHQNVYFADQAAIPFFVVCGFLCTKLIFESHSKPRFLGQAIALLFFLWVGLITDWFICFAWATIIGFAFKSFYTKALKNECSISDLKSFPKVVYFALLIIPPAFSILYFYYNLSGHFHDQFTTEAASSLANENSGTASLFDSITWLKNRFLYRSSGDITVLQFLKTVFIHWLGYYDLILLLSTLAIAFSIWKKTSVLFRFLFLYFIVTPLIQLFVFRNHSTIHDFSVLKLVPGLALFVGIIVQSYGAIASRFVKKWIPQWQIQSHVFALVIFGVLWIPQWGKFYKYFPDPRVITQDVAQWVRTTPSNAIILSDHYTIAHHPPQLLALSGKRVWKMDQVSQFVSWAEGRNLQEAHFYFLKKVSDVNFSGFDAYDLDSSEMMKLIHTASYSSLDEVFIKHGKLYSKIPVKD